MGYKTWHGIIDGDNSTLIRVNHGGNGLVYFEIECWDTPDGKALQHDLIVTPKAAELFANAIRDIAVEAASAGPKSVETP